MKDLIVLIVIVALGAAIWAAYRAKASEDQELNSLQSLPSSVSNVVAAMSPQQQAAFFEEYQKNKKSLVTAYLLWFFFSVYYFYFRKPGWNIALWLTMLVGVGYVWWIVDFFRMPSIRREYNAARAREVLQTLSLASSFQQPQQPLTSSFEQVQPQPLFDPPSQPTNPFNQQ
jgi:TM2 domain-containing membrane protein YozV